MRGSDPKRIQIPSRKSKMERNENDERHTRIS